MDQENQGRESCEKLKKLALDSQPDGCILFKAPVPDQPTWVYPQSSSPSRDPLHLSIPWDDTYSFNHKTRGFAVLVINSEFDSQPKRKDADLDEDKMNELFKKRNFDVYVLKNLASIELLKEMKAIRDKVSAKSDCFACVISSHGMEGEVSIPIPGVREPFTRTEHFTFTRDGVVRTNELLELFNDLNCKPLKGKPKMFFIQACRSRIDVQGSDEVDMGVEVLLVEATAPTTSTGSPARIFPRGETAPKSSNNTGDMAQTSSDNTEDVAPTNSTATGDVVVNYDHYTGWRRNEFRKNFTAATLDPLYKNCQVRGLYRQYPGYSQQDQGNVQASLQRQEPACTPTPTELEPEPEPTEVFQIPCYNDYLVMFSSAEGEA